MRLTTSLLRPLSSQTHFHIALCPTPLAHSVVPLLVAPAVDPTEDPETTVEVDTMTAEVPAMIDLDLLQGEHRLPGGTTMIDRETTTGDASTIDRHEKMPGTMTDEGDLLRPDAEVEEGATGL